MVHNHADCYIALIPPRTLLCRLRRAVGWRRDGRAGARHAELELSIVIVGSEKVVVSLRGELWHTATGDILAFSPALC